MNTSYNFSPIALFVYNRLDHTRQTVEHLKKNIYAKDSELFIFSDGHKDNNIKEVNSIRKYLETITGFKKIEIIKQEINQGLANSIINGCSQIFKNYNKLIIVEDDLITSPYFLKYMNEALDHYQNIKKILTIAGHNLPAKYMKFPSNYNKDVYFNTRNSSWGWGTWKDRWQQIDWQVNDYHEFINNKYLQKKFNLGGWDMTRMLKEQMNGKIDSWAIRWSYSQFKLNGLSVYPVNSYVKNIGLDNSGTHGSTWKTYQDDINLAKKDIVFANNPILDHKIMKNYRLAHIKITFFTDTFSKIKRELKKYLNTK